MFKYMKNSKRSEIILERQAVQIKTCITAMNCMVLTAVFVFLVDSQLNRSLIYAKSRQACLCFSKNSTI